MEAVSVPLSSAAVPPASTNGSASAAASCSSAAAAAVLPRQWATHTRRHRTPAAPLNLSHEDVRQNSYKEHMMRAYMAACVSPPPTAAAARSSARPAASSAAVAAAAVPAAAAPSASSPAPANAAGPRKRGRSKQTSRSPEVVDLTLSNSTSEEEDAAQPSASDAEAAEPPQQLAADAKPEAATRRRPGRPRKQAKVSEGAAASVASAAVPWPAAAAAWPHSGTASAANTAKDAAAMTDDEDELPLSSFIAAPSSSDDSASADRAAATESSDDESGVASSSASACPFCGHVYGPRASHPFHTSQHEAACATRTNEERQARAQRMQPRSSSQKQKKQKKKRTPASVSSAAAAPPSSNKAKKKSLLPAPSSPTASAAAARRSGVSSSTRVKKSHSDDDSDSDDQHPPKQSRSGRRRGLKPVANGDKFLIERAQLLQDAVGYELDDEKEAAAAKKKKVWEVEQVCNRRFNMRTLQYEYELKWFGWSEEENTWEPAKDTHCRDLIHEFHLRAEERLTLELDENVERALAIATAANEQPSSPSRAASAPPPPPVALRDSPAVCFHRDGLCVLTRPEHCLPASVVSSTEALVSARFNSTLKSLTNRDMLDVLETRGFDNFKLRDRGRYDMTLDPKELPFLANAPWLPIVQAILGGAAHLSHAGCMMSMPFSATQAWHSDGPHRSKDTHLPAYMCNVFVPLIDMNRRLGGTQLNPGSHVHHDEMIRTTSVTPLLKAGQAMLFDYRIRHRGLGNEDVVARPVLYFSYSARADIVDDANFKRGRYAPLPPLLVELDQSRAERLKKRRRQRGESSSSSSSRSGSDESDEDEDASEEGNEEAEENVSNGASDNADGEKNAADADQAAMEEEEDGESAAAALAPAVAAASSPSPFDERKEDPSAASASAAAPPPTSSVSVPDASFTRASASRSNASRRTKQLKPSVVDATNAAVAAATKRRLRFSSMLSARTSVAALRRDALATGQAAACGVPDLPVSTSAAAAVGSIPVVPSPTRGEHKSARNPHPLPAHIDPAHSVAAATKAPRGKNKAAVTETATAPMLLD